MTQVPIGALLAIAFGGIVVAALLSALEAAVLAVSRGALADAIEGDPRRQRRLAALRGDPREAASAAAFARIIAEMVATACITLSIAALLDVWWQVLGLAILASTLVAFLLVRLSPRTIGRSHPVGVIKALSLLLSTTVGLVGWVERFARKTGPGEDSDDRDGRAEHELREMVERVSDSEVIEDEDRELFRSVLELGDTLTREVMVPRTDMVTIQHTRTLDRAIALFLRSGFSRIPVTGESVDDLRGIIYLKDTIAYLRSEAGQDRESREVSHFMRPALFVPESKPVDDLLRELQLGASHMAIVVDEYGGIAGLVTMEDALEEIVGEMTDEHDRAVIETEDLGDGVFRVSARMGLDELGELLDLDIEDEEVDTAAGLLAKALGRVPLMGNHASVQGVHLRAERIEGRRKRLATLLVSLENPTGARNTPDAPQITDNEPVREVDNPEPAPDQQPDRKSET